MTVRANLPGVATHYVQAEKLLCGRPRAGALTTRITTRVDCKDCLKQLFRKPPR